MYMAIIAERDGLRAEIERLTQECDEAGRREVAAWAERDQYMNSNVKLVAEIKRLTASYERQVAAALREIERLTTENAHRHKQVALLTQITEIEFAKRRLKDTKP
jgi:hypothetical protein